MTKTEALKTRIRLARIFELPPDDVVEFAVEEVNGREIHFYDVPYRNITITMGVSIEDIPYLKQSAIELVDKIESWLESFDMDGFEGLL